MTDITKLDKIFFEENGLNKHTIENIVTDSLNSIDDGELFLEFSQSESLAFDDGVLKNASFNNNSGFGFRSVLGEITGYAHSTEISENAIKEAAQTIKSIRKGYSGQTNISKNPLRTNRHLYNDINPLNEVSFANKVKIITEIDHYLRNKNPDVKQVLVSLSGEWQAIEIIRSNGFSTGDIRPLVRLNISVTVEKNGRMEKGSFGTGGRELYNDFISKHNWQNSADEALRQALVNLDSIPAPAGEMKVVLGPGWPGILLHEAVGHGLEGDFNRKKTSAFSGLIGQRVAAPGITVIDDGTIDKRRGSLTIDDEGTPTEKTILIEDGILKGYMFDRMNAHLMGQKPTGNGRRESFQHQPLPRMTNTCMLGGKSDPKDIISSVDKGIYAVNFGGGQVDITSGKFVFSASEAYLIENGQITKPVKGATLIGNGPEVLKKVTMIGNDMQLDPGIGTCGKAGQGVPVGVGQPTLLIDSLTVGGTEVA